MLRPHQIAFRARVVAVILTLYAYLGIASLWLPEIKKEAERPAGSDV